MIKDTEKRQNEFKNFPSVPYEIEQEIIRDVLPQFLFYKKSKSGNSAWVFCTSCRRSSEYYSSRYIDGIEIMGSELPKKLKHNGIGMCPMCGHSVTYKCKGRGHKTLTTRANVLTFIARDNCLYAHADKYEADYWHSIDEPDINCYHFRRYAFLPGESQAWKFKGYSGWSEMTVVKEPIYNLSGVFLTMYTSNPENIRLFTVMNEQAIYETFLKYQEWDRYAMGDGFHIIRFLDFTSKHTELAEQLTKSGFDKIISDISGRDMYGFSELLNLKAKKIKRALRFTVPEINYWRDSLMTGEYSLKALSDYIACKKIYPQESMENMLNLFKSYHPNIAQMICKCAKMANVSIKKAENYIKRMLKSDITTPAIAEWQDCLQMLNNLGYPEDTSLRFPKNIKELHDRLVKETNALKEKEAQKRNKAFDKKIKQQEKELSKFIYSNRLYTIVLPESMSDIYREGKLLDHCVASYAERHANGKLHIFFIRKVEDPDTPWYTMEVSTDGHIVQCYGYKNNRTELKPKSVKQFEKEYRLFLDRLFGRVSKSEFEKKAM